MPLNPLTSAFMTVMNLFTGRLRFDRSRIGETFLAGNGQCFEVFRCAVLNPRPGQPARPGAVFIPHFHVRNMSLRANIWFSLIPMWFILGLPGFRSKCWMVDLSTGDNAGYYEWDTIEDAQNYANSFAMRFMRSRSVPDSVWFHVYPAEQAPKPPSRQGTKG